MSQVLTFPFHTAAAPATFDPASELAIAGLLEGEDLDRAGARSLFARIVEGSLSEPLMAAAFVALRVKGETAEELIGAAQALRAAARPFPAPAGMFADMYKSRNGRPGLPPQVLAATVALRALHGLSDFETVQARNCGATCGETERAVSAARARRNE